MINKFSRTEILIGEEAMERLKRARVCVFGAGGVGGYAIEALARSGVGALDIVDNDTVDLTNINRQIYATVKTVGRYKVDVAAERVLDINPDAKVKTYKLFYMPDTAEKMDFSNYDYIIDAIDTVAGKLEIIKNAKNAQVPVISSMGAGNKFDAAAFEVADIYKTSVCPLARVMRCELRKMGIDGLKVVYSREKAKSPKKSEENADKRRQIPGSMSYVPSVAGLILAGEVIKDIAKIEK